MFNNEHLREIMTIYLSTMYEEAARYDEDTMMQEYINLRDNCQLHRIFEAVEQYNNVREEA